MPVLRILARCLSRGVTRVNGRWTMRIVITAGHSNTDPGAVGNGYKEADFCADMRNYVTYYLRNWGFKVETDGAGRTNAPLAQAIQLAREAEIAIEFHLNAAVNKNAEGIEVLALHTKRALAQKIAMAINRITKSPLRGDKGYKTDSSGQHSRLGFCRAGGLIVELDFVSNKKRMDTLNELRWVVAKEIATAIKDYIGG